MTGGAVCDIVEAAARVFLDAVFAFSASAKGIPSSISVVAVSLNPKAFVSCVRGESGRGDRAGSTLPGRKVVGSANGSGAMLVICIRLKMM